MPVLKTSKFDEGPIKNECASLETPLSHYKSMGYFLEAQGHLTLKRVVFRDFMPVLVSVETSFSPIISQRELSVATATTVLMESAPKPKRSLSPIPLMIHIKFDQDWPTDLGDSIISLFKI